MSRGGPRKGAGRKPLPPELQTRGYTLHLRPRTMAWIRALAEHNAQSVDAYLTSLLAPLDPEEIPGYFDSWAGAHGDRRLEPRT